MVHSFAKGKATESEALMMLPPGLEPPPGLESVAPPPGLEMEGYDEEIVGESLTYVPAKNHPMVPEFVVQLSCLPNHILNEAMMTVTLEQARLDMFATSIATKKGDHRGDAFITFSSMGAAILCTRHFQGRRWDASGTMVQAWVLPMAPAPVPAAVCAAKTTKKRPKQKPSKTLSAEAPEFTPSWALSADAPEFTPSFLAATKDVPVIGSDVSTEDGESTVSSDEKDAVTA
jgi:hypothetical protein